MFGKFPFGRGWFGRPDESQPTEGTTNTGRRDTFARILFGGSWFGRGDKSTQATNDGSFSGSATGNSSAEMDLSADVTASPGPPIPRRIWEKWFKRTPKPQPQKLRVIFVEFGGTSSGDSDASTGLIADATLTADASGSSEFRIWLSGDGFAAGDSAGESDTSANVLADAELSASAAGDSNLEGTFTYNDDLQDIVTALLFLDL